MAVPAVNIVIEQGTDFSNVFTVTNPDGSPLDLTGFNSSAKIKKFPTSAKSTPFTVGIITAAGQVVVSMAHTVTNSLDPGRYYYDVITISYGGTINRIIEGMALVTPSVSTT